MTVKRTAAVTGGAIVAGWIAGIAALFATLMYGPDLPDRFDI
jgi:hypothetical protein